MVGASERGQWQRLIYSNLRDYGYPGRVFLVNPRQQEVFGQRCYPSLRELPEPVDHAMVIVPAAGVADVLTDADAAGVKSATRLRGGDGRRPGPGIAEARRLAQGFLARSKLRIAGPNCMGAHSYRERLFAYPNTELGALPGRLGRLHLPVRRHAAVLAAHRRRPRLALLLRHHVRQRGRSRPRRLSQLPGRRSAHAPDRAVHRRHPPARRPSCRRRAARSQPASRSSRSRPAPPRNRKPPRSRTPARSAATTRPISRCASATASCNCRSLDDMLETALAFDGGRLPKGPRIGFVTTSGGTVDLLYDYAESRRRGDAGLRAGNPRAR